jgi:ribosomal protein L37AE/L43A
MKIRSLKHECPACHGHDATYCYREGNEQAWQCNFCYAVFKIKGGDE